MKLPGKKKALRKARDFMAEPSRFVASAIVWDWTATSRLAVLSRWEEML
jgi:hypothetical protein